MTCFDFKNKTRSQGLIFTKYAMQHAANGLRGTVQYHHICITVPITSMLPHALKLLLSLSD